MNPVDRIARLGWLATATLALAMASACASTQTPASAQTPVSTTTTTGAQVVEPGSELYPSRQAVLKCGGDLRENVDFMPRSASIDRSDMPDIDRWARCLNQPEMKHATIVLVGGQARSEPEGLFVERAGRVRDALIARGVDARRIVIGTANASRDGTPFAGNTGVRLELTHEQSLREFVPPDTGVRAPMR